MLKLTSITAITLLTFHVIAEPEIKGTPAELAQFLQGVPKTTLLTGEAEVRVPAHRAVVNLKVTTESKSFQEAMRSNQEIRAKLLDQLRKRGVPADRVNASRFSSTPQPGLFTDKARSFRIENVMRISIQDENELNGVAGIVDAWSEVQFLGVEFEYADKEALKEKALSQACDRVGQKKELYQAKFGVHLTPVTFSQADVRPMNATPNFGGYSARAVASGVALSEAMSAGADVAAGVNESVSSFGELVYTARVAVEYAVRQRPQ